MESLIGELADQVNVLSERSRATLADVKGVVQALASDETPTVGEKWLAVAGNNHFCKNGAADIPKTNRQKKGSWGREGGMSSHSATTVRQGRTKGCWPTACLS